MSAYSDQLAAKMGAVIDGHIDIKTATKVPETADVRLDKNQGFMVDATYLYADLVNSSTLAQNMYKPVTAKIIRSYINGAADILRHYDGEIRSFDGDRVMAIFMGEGKETMAVSAAMAVNWLVDQYLLDKVKSTWSDIGAKWTFGHSVGIDTGEALITRAGVRGDNDLISIGAAPNVAAKLSDLRDFNTIHITKAVYEAMDDSIAFIHGQPDIFGRVQRTQMWSNLPNISVGGKFVQPLGSTYWLQP